MTATDCKVSMVERASGTETPAVSVTATLEAIRNGKYSSPIAVIRERYRATLTESDGDHSQAKKAVDPLKKALPGILFSGVFNGRGDGKLAEYSGLICADLDGLDDQQKAEARLRLTTDAHVFALFESPTGTGLKVVFAVERDASKHAANFAAVRQHVRELCALPVDESCKNVERLCFVSDDPEALIRPEAKPLPALVTDTAAKKTEPGAAWINPSSRQQIAVKLIGQIQWKTETEGFCHCPGAHLHTSGNGARDCRVTLDGAPTLSCFHNSCRGIIEAVNRQLRSDIGKAERPQGLDCTSRLSRDLTREQQEAEDRAADVAANGAPERAKEITLEELLAVRRFNPDLNPPPIRPVYTLCGVTICTRGNLATFVAAAKTGKTATLGGMTAAVFKAPDAEVDTLGFWAENPEGKAVLHFDTEQSTEDHWHVVRRAMRRAGVDTLPPWFFSYCLTGFNALKAQAAVRVATLAALKQCGGVHSVLIDGYADLVADVNDAAECNGFVSRLHDWAIEWDCPIAGVLHFNPGTEKGRGHLGSQLERKSETNLRMDKEGIYTEIWSEKQRRAPILKGQGPRFCWDDGKQMHVSVESGREARLSVKAETAKNYVEDVFHDHRAMRYGDLKSTVQTVLKVTERWAEKKIDEWRKLGVIEKTVAGLWVPRTYA